MGMLLVSRFGLEIGMYKVMAVNKITIKYNFHVSVASFRLLMQGFPAKHSDDYSLPSPPPLQSHLHTTRRLLRISSIWNIMLDYFSVYV